MVWCINMGPTRWVDKGSLVPRHWEIRPHSTLYAGWWREANLKVGSNGRKDTELHEYDGNCGSEENQSSTLPLPSLHLSVAKNGGTCRKHFRAGSTCTMLLEHVVGSAGYICV